MSEEKSSTFTVTGGDFVMTDVFCIRKITKREPDTRNVLGMEVKDPKDKKVTMGLYNKGNTSSIPTAEVATNEEFINFVIAVIREIVKRDLPRIVELGDISEAYASLMDAHEQEKNACNTNDREYDEGRTMTELKYLDLVITIDEDGDFEFFDSCDYMKSDSH